MSPVKQFYPDEDNPATYPEVDSQCPKCGTRLCLDRGTREIFCPGPPWGPCVYIMPDAKAEKLMGKIK